MSESSLREQRREVRRIIGQNGLTTLDEHDRALAHHASVLQSLADHIAGMDRAHDGVTDAQRIKNLEYERRIRALETRALWWKFWSRW